MFILGLVMLCMADKPFKSIKAPRGTVESHQYYNYIGCLSQIQIFITEMVVNYEEVHPKITFSDRDWV